VDTDTNFKICLGKKTFLGLPSGPLEYGPVEHHVSILGWGMDDLIQILTIFLLDQEPFLT